MEGAIKGWDCSIGVAIGDSNTIAPVRKIRKVTSASESR